MARPRGNKWQADALIEGRRVRRSFDSEDEAVTWENRVAAGLPEDAPDTLRAFADDQFDAIWGEVKAPENVCTNLETAYRFFGTSATLVSITTRRCDEFVSYMKKQENLSNSSVNRKLSTLSKLLRRAVRMELIPKRPEIEYEKEPKGRDRVLSKQEEQALIGKAEHFGMAYTANLIKFLLYTGCRVGEAYKLTREDLKDGRVTFRDTKNGDDRSVTLVGPALDAWRFMLTQSDLNCPFSVLPRGTFRHQWETLKIHIGCEDDKGFVPHMLRHTCATRLVVSNVALTKVMKWMGHRNIQTTMRYSHLAPRDIDDCANALSDFAA